jgi:hypothetical protein
MAFGIYFMFEGETTSTLIGTTEDGSLADVKLTRSTTACSSLEFTLYPDHARWTAFTQTGTNRKMRIMGTFKSSDLSYDSKYYDFVGTVVNVVAGMTSDGLPYRTITCESLDAGLNEMYIHTDLSWDDTAGWYTTHVVNSDGSVNVTVKELLAAIDTWSEKEYSWNVPKVNFSFTDEIGALTIAVEPQHRACVADLISGILETHNLQIQCGVLRVGNYADEWGDTYELNGTITKKKLDRYRGSLYVGEELLECELEVDMSDIVTVLRPYGDTYEVSYTSNSGAEYVQNIPIEAGYFINAGHLTKNTDKYGYIPAVYQITGVVDTTDESYFTNGVFDPAKLTAPDKQQYQSLAAAYLEKHCEPAVEISIDSYDVAVIGKAPNHPNKTPLPYEWWTVSNNYCWNNPNEYLVEVIERTWDFNNPERLTLKLGNTKKTATSTNANTRRTATSAQATATSASSNAQSAYRKASKTETWVFLTRNDSGLVTTSKSVVVA